MSMKKKTFLPRIFIASFHVLFFLIFIYPAESIPLQTVTIQEYPLMKEGEARSVIFLIGDGMGATHVIATRLKHYGFNGRLFMERMPVAGYDNTICIDGTITDSSAAATALATGFKTKNGMISVTPEGDIPFTIMESCRGAGKSTGVVVTCDITQSTPAGFYSHSESRWDSPRIAEDLIKSKLNVAFGGGRAHFVPQSDAKSRRQDEMNLIETARSKGIDYVESKDQMNSSSQDYILGLFGYDNLKADATVPSLAEMTQKSIQLLSRNQKGFFLMVEGSLIDSYCHRNNTDLTLDEIKYFDDAVKVALDFALADQHTLVVVTGDHETGGLVIDGGSYENKTMDIKWMTRFHTAVPTPIYAFGPGAEHFTGTLENSEIPVCMARLLKITNFPAIREKAKKQTEQ